jgi:hypothetical protein
MVTDFDIGKDGVWGFGPGRPPMWIAEFVLQEAMPGLTTRIIVTIPGSADAGLPAVGA